jgi:AcrR family transcriptional regulator
VVGTSKLLGVDDVKQSRAERAAATRQRMLDAAYELFCELGYRATTMAAIADRAQVAVQTVYFTFHTKDTLLQEVHNQTVLGRDPIPPEQQPWHLAARAQTNPRRAVELIVTGVATILSRVAPMMPVFHAVAADEAGAVYRQAERLRRTGMNDLADFLADQGWIRAGVDRARASDLLFVLLGPEIYRTFVLELDWSPEEWATWTTETLVRDLVKP